MLSIFTLSCSSPQGLHICEVSGSRTITACSRAHVRHIPGFDCGLHFCPFVCIYSAVRMGERGSPGKAMAEQCFCIVTKYSNLRLDQKHCCLPALYNAL